MCRQTIFFFTKTYCSFTLVIVIKYKIVKCKLCLHKIILYHLCI